MSSHHKRVLRENYEWLRDHGLSEPLIARRLHLAPKTLEKYIAEWRKEDEA